MVRTRRGQRSPQRRASPEADVLLPTPSPSPLSSPGEAAAAPLPPPQFRVVGVSGPARSSRRTRGLKRRRSASASVLDLLEPISDTVQGLVVRHTPTRVGRAISALFTGTAKLFSPPPPPPFRAATARAVPAQEPSAWAEEHTGSAAPAAPSPPDPRENTQEQRKRRRVDPQPEIVAQPSRPIQPRPTTASSPIVIDSDSEESPPSRPPPAPAAFGASPVLGGPGSAGAFQKKPRAPFKAHKNSRAARPHPGALKKIQSRQLALYRKMVEEQTLESEKILAESMHSMSLGAAPQPRTPGLAGVNTSTSQQRRWTPSYRPGATAAAAASPSLFEPMHRSSMMQHFKSVGASLRRNQQLRRTQATSPPPAQEAAPPSQIPSKAAAPAAATAERPAAGAASSSAATAAAAAVPATATSDDPILLSDSEDEEAAGPAGAGAADTAADGDILGWMTNLSKTWQKKFQAREREVDAAKAKDAALQAVDSWLISEAQLSDKVKAMMSQGTARELTDEEEDEVDRMFEPGDPNEGILEHFDIQIYRKDFYSLEGSTWLNDNVINFYMKLICVGRPKTWAFSSHFLTTFQDGGYKRVARWTRRCPGKDLFALDLVLVPVHLGTHWACGLLNFGKKRFEYYDSMIGRSDHGFCRVMRAYLKQEYKAKHDGEELDLDDWEDVVGYDCPQQNNCYDCGVFLIKFAQSIAGRRDFDFSQDDMPRFRREIVWEILHHTLLAPVV